MFLFYDNIERNLRNTLKIEELKYNLEKDFV